MLSLVDSCSTALVRVVGAHVVDDDAVVSVRKMMRMKVCLTKVQ